MASGDLLYHIKKRGTGTTTDDTTMSLITLAIPTGTEGVVHAEARVWGIRYTGSNAHWHRIMQSGGEIDGAALDMTSEESTTVVSTHDPGTVGYGASIDDDGAGNLRVRVAGETSHDVRWFGEVDVWVVEQTLSEA
jgi:hypothetical protein